MLVKHVLSSMYLSLRIKYGGSHEVCTFHFQTPSLSYFVILSELHPEIHGPTPPSYEDHACSGTKADWASCMFFSVQKKYAAQQSTPLKQSTRAFAPFAGNQIFFVARAAGRPSPEDGEALERLFDGGWWCCPGVWGVGGVDWSLGCWWG